MVDFFGKLGRKLKQSGMFDEVALHSHLDLELITTLSPFPKVEDRISNQFHV